MTDDKTDDKYKSGACDTAKAPETCFTYTVLRFHPRPSSGEFLNTGLVIGRDDGDELQYWVDDIYWRLHPSQVGLYDAAVADFIETLVRTGYRTIEQLIASHGGGIYSYSHPYPVIGSTAEEAKDRLWGTFLAARPHDVCPLCSIEKRYDGSDVDPESHTASVYYKDKAKFDKYWIWQGGCELCKARDSARTSRTWGKIARDKETNILRAIYGRATK